MPETPNFDDEGHALLNDAEFDAVRDMSKEQFEVLPAERREAADWTNRWHFGQRQQMDVGSMYVGGKPYAEVLAEIEAEETGEKE